MAISDAPTNSIVVLRNENVTGRVMLKFGASYLFLSGSILMISGGVPASNTDGKVIGKQT